MVHVKCAAISTEYLLGAVQQKFDINADFLWADFLAISSHPGLIVPIVDAKEKTEKIAKLLNYFKEPRNHNKHNWYAIKFYFCEFLNFVNVIGQIFLMDFFLGGEFTTYGSEVNIDVKTFHQQTGDLKLLRFGT